MKIPGGIQEIGESIEQAVCREIHEELGLDLNPRTLVGIYSSPRWAIIYPEGWKIQPLIFFFLMEGQITTINIQASVLTDYQFYSLDDIPENPMECCK